jgi:hypothetical protein
MKLVSGYGSFRPVSRLAAFAATEDFVRRADQDDGIDWPADVPPEYLGEPMALWSQATIPPGSTAPFQQEALRNPYDDAFFEVHGLNLTLANPNAATDAILTLATLGISFGIADDNTHISLTKDFVPANVLFGMRGAPFATPYNEPTAPAAGDFPFATLQVRFAFPWLLPPRWMITAAAASRSSAVQQAVIAEVCFQGRKVPHGAVRQRTNRLPYHAGFQFQPVQAATRTSVSGSATSAPSDLMNVTDTDVNVTSLIGGLTQFLGSTYGYGAFDIFPDPTTWAANYGLPAGGALFTLTSSDGYPIIPPQTPIRLAFALPGGDWPVSFTMRPKDYLIARQDLTLTPTDVMLSPGIYSNQSGAPIASAISVGLAGWREVAL